MKKLLFFLLLFASSQIYCQSKQPLRVEVDVEESDNTYVIPVGSEGVVLLQEADKTIKGDRGNKYWTLTKYNTDFQKVTSKDIAISKKQDMYKYCYDSTLKVLYILYTSGGSVVTASSYSYVQGDYQLVRISLKDLSVKTLTGTMENAMTLVDLTCIDDNVTFGGYTVLSASQMVGKVYFTLCCLGIPAIFGSMHFTPKACYFNADFKLGKINPKFLMQYVGPTKINDISVNAKDKKTDIIVENVPDKLAYNIDIIEMNNKGEQEKTINMKLNRDKQILNAKLTKPNSNDIFVIGTYGEGVSNSKSIANIGTTSFGAQGMFIGKIVEDKPQFVKFYSFSKFKQFFAFLSTKTQQKIEKKIKKKEAKGKDISYGYSFLVHDIIKQGDTYIMIAEAYYPEYHYETYTTCSNNGCTTHTRRVFDGYRYTHAVMAGFNKDGDLLWDNCFEIQNILTYTLKQRIKVLLQPNNNIALVYNYAGRINSKVFKGNTVVDSKSSEKIETNFSGDQVKSDFGSDIDFWYDNYMIAYGFQKIKNKEAEKGEKKKRNIFYFNKVSYQ